jgi:hypothetical protein
MFSRMASLALCSLALLACGGSVVVSEGTGTTGGPEGTGGAGGAVGTGGFGGTGGLGGGGGDTTGVGGAGGMCTRTMDSFVYTLAPQNGGPSLDCNSAQPGGMGLTTHLEASVISVVNTADETDITLDTCPPNADCTGNFYKLVVKSPGFALYVLQGAYVQIDVDVQHPWGCTSAILMRNLPVWGGLQSSLGSVPYMLFEGADGAAETLDGSPFTLTTTPLHCNEPFEGCDATPDEYRFDVTDGSEIEPVYQGQTELFGILDNGMQNLIYFHNLRSYESGYCDDGANWAYWAVVTTPKD